MTSTTAAPTSTFPRGAGPLTTVFTTPEFCASSAWVNYDTPALSSSICMPNGFTSYWNYMFGFYSPGICPESYTAGCVFPTARATSSNGTPFLGGPLQSGESAIMCCPIGYVCVSEPTDMYDSSKCIATTASTYILPATTATRITTTPRVFAIQVRWKSSDLNALETNPTESSVTITPTPTSTSAEETSGAAATATAAGSAASASSTDSSSGGSNFSTGAAIGVGVGVAAAVVILAIVSYVFWKRSRSRKAAALSGDSDDGVGKGRNKFSELQDTQISRGSTHAPAELQSPEGTWQSSTWGGSTAAVSPLSPRPHTATTGGVTEMEVPNTRHELTGHVTDFAEMPASNQFVAELPGDMPGHPRSPREKWQM